MSQKRKDQKVVKKCKSATFQLDGFCYTIERRVLFELEITSNSSRNNNSLANPPDNESLETEANEKEETGEKQVDELPGSSIVVRKSAQRTSSACRKWRAEAEAGDENIEGASPLETCETAAQRLRELSDRLQVEELPTDELLCTVNYAATALESICLETARRLLNDDKEEGDENAEEDELSEVQPDAVPREVREWLASTFTRQSSSMQRKKGDDKPRFRSVAHAIRAGIFVDRIYRRCFSSSNLQMPAPIVQLLKGVDNWDFDVFSLNSAASGQSLRYLGHCLLNRYGLIQKFKIPASALENFLAQMELGYEKWRNPYHNGTHAADVTQTVHYFLCQGGLANWLSDLEILATLVSAIIHDFEHTGTTNTFHVMSRSETALLYNDRAVLENYHISQAFRLMKEEENNILCNLSKEEYREFRSLVIEMVIATDMSSHFQQIKTMKSLLCHSDFSTMDKSKALSLVLHCCDISHPGKKWDVHFLWTQRLMEEFFRQGDKEKELGIPFSPLCDRNTTLVAESQIGFIDFIVSPSMEVCSVLLDKVSQHIQNLEASPSDSNTANTGPRNSDELLANEFGCISSVSSTRPWMACLSENKNKWHNLKHKDAELRASIRTDYQI